MGVATGGVMGFVKKRSVPSLLAGLSFGGLAAFGAYDASENPETPYVGAAVAGLLGTAMGARALKSKSFMPAGAVSVLCLLCWLNTALQSTKERWVKWKSENTLYRI